eukprot:472519-Amorphochlora_amoeboformis.AAC.1
MSVLILGRIAYFSRANKKESKDIDSKAFVRIFAGEILRGSAEGAASLTGGVVRVKCRKLGKPKY